MKRTLRVLVTVAALLAAAVPTFAQSNLSRALGKFYAPNYGKWNATIASGNSATGSQTISVNQAVVSLPDGRVISPFSVTSPIIVDLGSNQETVTPTAVSNCYAGAPNGSCQITASFSNVHGQGAMIMSSTAGLAEAQYDAVQQGGGEVVVDSAWTQMGGTDAMLSAAIPYQGVVFEDVRKAGEVYWSLQPSTTSLLAAPTTLTAQAACDSTHTFCSDASVAGSASWGGTVYGCITLVDINGNESPCSATANFTSVASKAIDIGAPTAVTNNVVGWKPYLSVSGGSYALAYSLPLLTQPTVLLAVPVSAGVCTLTTLETITPACAIGNATYGQAASATGAAGLFSKGGAQFTGYPVVTNTLAPEIGSASALAHNPSEEAHATYAYVPGGRLGAVGIQSSHFLFPITAAAQTTIGEVEGSIPLPANFMNYIGRTIEVCGLIVKTSTVADTVDEIQIWWDAEGSNVTAGTPVQLSSIKITEATALAAAANFHFCQQLTTSVASTSATGGSIIPGLGWASVSQVSAGANPSGGSSSLVAAVGSLNLALPAHLTIELKHTTGTDGAGSTLQGATVRVIN